MKLYLKYVGIFFILSTLFFAPTAWAQKKDKKKNVEKSVSDRDQSAAEAYFAEGMKYYILENYGKALDFFHNSLNLNPKSAATHYQIAEALMQNNQLDKAIPYAEKAIQLNDQNKYYYLLLAKIYELKQNFGQAAKVYEKLLAKGSGYDEYYFDLASVYLQQGEYKEALKIYDKIEKSFGISEDLSIQKQKIYLKINKLDLAIQEGEKLIKAFPDEPRYTIVLTQLLIANQKFDEAKSILEKIPEGNTLINSQAHLLLADIYRSKGDTLKGDTELQAAFNNPELDVEAKIKIIITYIRANNNNDQKQKTLKLAKTITQVHPHDAKGFAIYADLLALLDSKEESRYNYLKAAKLDKSMFEVWSQIIRLDAELKQVDSLVKHSQQALEIFPNQAEFWYYNGAANIDKKNFKEGIKSLEQGRDLALTDANLFNRFTLYLADAYHAAKEYDKSDAAYEEVLKNTPDNAYALNNYSYYLALRNKNLRHAKEMAEKLIKNNPDQPNYIDTYAWVLYKMGDYKGAKEYLEKALQTANSGAITEHYGDVLYQLNEKDKALEQWKKAKDLTGASDLIDKKIMDKKLYEEK